MTVSDQEYMGLALQQARDAETHGEVPVGAIIVVGGEVIASGRNAPIQSVDPTAHAEIVALRGAAAKLDNYRFIDATLYVTLEPCAMCAGAMVHARISRLVYGCADPRGGAAGSVFDVVNSPKLNHRIAVTPGIREAECRALLQMFFRARR